jgi:protein-disulfide isomerase
MPTKTPSPTPLRSNRLFQLAALLGAAVVIVVAAILISSGGGAKKPAAAPTAASLKDTAQVNGLLAGIPQSGITLGDPAAPVTIEEFVDPQCPFCRDFAVNELPTVVAREVRTGKAKLQLRMLTFISGDSVKAGRAFIAAGAQGKLFNALDIMYHNQGEERSGYVTDAYLNGVLRAVPGLDAAQALKAAGGTAVSQELSTATTAARRYAIDSTPTLLVGKTGGELKKVGSTAGDVHKAVVAAS